MMKRLGKRIVCLLLGAGLLLGYVPTALAADATTVQVVATYDQKDARSMLPRINDFRQGDEAWYWDETDTRKVQVSGLKPLSYDYGLERIAMRRAAEISLLFEHQRPNGDTCFSAYREFGYEVVTAGENIAYLQFSDANAAVALELWKETDYPYGGQGHRRNMLDADFTAIGIAHARVNGVDYWVQELGSPNTGAADPHPSSEPVAVTVELEHRWEEGDVLSEPTFWQAGMRTVTCLNCGVSDIAEMPCYHDQVRDGGVSEVMPVFAALAGKQEWSLSPEAVDTDGDGKVDVADILTLYLLASGTR